MTTKDEELSIVEVRALRDMIDEMKKDLAQIHEYLKQSKDAGDSIDDEILKLVEKYLPKGEPNGVQKNTAT